MLFSVIVPIYKVEPYLPRCVESILAQDYQDFELILVDDGSPDGCPALCDGYAARDSRVKVIHKPNGGLVSARQAGIQAARGEYVLNVDGDDSIAPRLLGQAAALIKKWDPDLVSFAVTYLEETGSRTVCEPLPEGFYDRTRKEAEIYPRMLMAPNMEHTFYYLCGKVIRRSLLFPHQMAVDPGISLGEDVTCLMPVYRDAGRVYLCSKPLYLCLVRPGSDSRTFRPAQLEQIRLGLQALDKLVDVPDFPSQVDRYISFLCFALMQALCKGGRKDHRRILFQFLKDPAIQQRVQRARFRGVTPKMRITYFLFRRGWFSAALVFLRMCKTIKR